LASATLTEDIKTLVTLALKKPIRVNANKQNALSPTLNQFLVRIRDDKLREATLLALIRLHVSK